MEVFLPTSGQCHQLFKGADNAKLHAVPQHIHPTVVIFCNYLALDHGLYITMRVAVVAPQSFSQCINRLRAPVAASTSSIRQHSEVNSEKSCPASSNPKWFTSILWYRVYGMSRYHETYHIGCYRMRLRETIKNPSSLTGCGVLILHEKG
jgi:hypothetical protein